MNATHSNTGYTESLQQKRARANNTIISYMGAAAAKGAPRVPGLWVLIAVNNAPLVHRIQSIYGVPFSVAEVAASFPSAWAAKAAGRALCLEAARAASWAIGMPLGAAWVNGLAAATAAGQTAAVGLIAMAVAENGGRPLSPAQQSMALQSLEVMLNAARAERAKRGA
jgi:hypothetical protein